MLREELVGRRVKTRSGLFRKGAWATVIEWKYPPGLYAETPTMIAVRFDDGLEGAIECSRLESYV